MLFVISRGSVPTYTEGQEPLIYLVSTAEAAAATGSACLCSDGNCASTVTQLYKPLEGHYLRGYGDRTQQVLTLSPIALMPGAEDEAERWLDSHHDEATTGRINAVMEFVEGFASAYGLELLATVHWAATRELGTGEADLAALTELIRNWSERKGRLFTEVHIRKAAEHLVRLQ